MAYPYDDAPYPGQNIVGWVAYHLPHAIAFAEAEEKKMHESRKYWAQVYHDRDLCPVGHQPSISTESCGYCESARRWVFDE